MAATYAIGDIHGHFATLRSLLARLESEGPIDWEEDRLWLVGDLVNRGPDSLAVLRWARECAERMGDRFSLVLGNHDLHLIAVADGVNPLHKRDELDEVLEATDGAELIGWLRRRPLLVRHRNRLLVHAGLLPEWTVGEALAEAEALSARLAEPERAAVLLLKRPDKDLLRRKTRRLRRALDAFTRLRMMTKKGKVCSFAGPPEEAPKGCRPWFDLPHRRRNAPTVVAGHWAALGVRLRDDLVTLDSGCGWHQKLTAVRLEDRRIIAVPAGSGSNTPVKQPDT